MTTTKTSFLADVSRQEKVSELRKLTAAGLISIGFCFLGMLFLVWRQFPTLSSVLVMLPFALALIVLSGRRWTPTLGTLYCFLLLLANGSLSDFGLTYVSSGPFRYLSALLWPIVLITFVSGMFATVQNYRLSVAQGPMPLWLSHALCFLAAICLGTILLSFFLSR